VALKLWDRTSGSAGTTVNPGSGGGTSAYSADSRTFTLKSTGISLSGANNTVTLSESQSLNPGSALTLTGGNLGSARVQVASGFTPGDVLSYTPPGGSAITASYDASAGVLTLSGNASSSEYEAALRAVQFSVGEDPTQFSAKRQIAYLLDNQTTSTAFTTVTITAEADAPTLSSGTALTYTEGGTGIVLHPTLGLADLDDLKIASATVSISAGRTADDLLELGALLGTSSPITGSYNSVTGVLSLSGTASVADYELALRSVTYRNTGTNPTNSGAALSRSIRFSVTDANSDGFGSAAAGDTTVNVTVNAVNVAPVLTAGGQLSYTEGGAAAVLDAGITISDADDTQLTGAVLEISSGYTAGDQLALASQNGITGSFDAATGTLTLTGTATVAQYQTALRTVTFSSSSGDPTASYGSRTVSVQVTDANRDAAPGGTATSPLASSTITLTPAADAPVVSVGNATTPSYTEAGAPVALSPNLILSDADDTQLSKAVVSISSGLSSGDLLGFTPVNGISGSLDEASGRLTFTGAASLGTYQTLLRSVTFSSSSSTLPNTGSRTISIQVLDANSDGLTPQWSTVATAALDVLGVNQAPLLSSATGTTSYAENDSETPANGQLTLSDSDSAQLSGATVTISAGLTTGDILALPAAVATSTGITPSYNSGSGVLTLSGDASVGTYQKALRAVTFSSSSDTPTATSTTRTLSWQVTDKDANTPVTSTVLTSTLNLTGVNDTPTLTDFSGPVASGSEDTEITLTYSDLIGNTGNKAQVADADGTVSSLQVTKLLSGSLRIGSSAVTATAYVAGSNDVLNASTNAYWTPATNANGPALNAFAVVAREDNGALVSIQPRSVQVAVTPDHADAASITSLALPANDTYVLGQALDFTVTFDRAVTVDTTNGTPSLPLSLNSGGAIAAAYRSGSGTDTLSFRYTVGAGDLDVDGLSLGSALSLNNATITSIDDSQPVNAGLILPGIGSTAGLRVDGVNDAPVLGGTPAVVSYNENDPETAANGQITLSDSDSAQLSGATVTISAGLTAGDLLALPLAVATSTGITAYYNSGTGVLTLSGDASVGGYQQALRAVTFSSSSDNPTATSSSRTLSWQVTDKDATTPASSTVLTSTLTLTGVNDTPTLTDFSGPLASGGEDTETTLTYSDLIGNTGNKAQVADADGTVSSLKVDKLLSGSLRIGSSSATATAYVAGSNDVLNAGTNAYWTPAANANGPALNAFAVVAREDSGALVSIQPRSVQVAVTPDHADAASITRLVLPANDTYVLGQVLDFTVTFDRAVTVDTANGTPSLPLSLNSGGAIAAAYRSGSGTDTLSFRYTVGAGDLDVDGLSLGSALSLNNGTITSIDDSQPVNAGLSLPGIGSTAGLQVDGVNNAPVLGGTPAVVSYNENDPETAANGQLTLSDSDSAQLSGATVTISAGLTAGDLLALPTAVANSTGITPSYNSGTGVLTLSGDASVGTYQKALRAVTFSSSSDIPTATSASRTLSWQVTDKDANTPATSTVLTSPLTLTGVNDTPTLTDFSGPLASGGEDTEITLTYSDLIGNTGNKAQVADADGTVTSLKVDKLLSGLLRIGSSSATATAYVAGSNDVLTASTNAYWTPTANANGSALDAFRLVALDDGGALVSIQPRSVQAAVTPDHADAASITSLVLPANDTYVLGQVLDFTVTFDRAVTVDTANGTPSLPLSLNSGGAIAAAYRSGSGTDTLSFRYTVGAGDLDVDGLSLGSALSLNNGTITSIDDSQPVNAGLILPGIGSTAGLQVDGVNNAPVLGGTPAVVSYNENDPETAANGQITLSDSDSAQLSGATVTISAGLTTGDILALPAAVATSTGITPSYNSGNGVLTLSGDASVGTYQKALRAVTFSSSSDTPTATSTSRTLSWQVTDKDATTPAASSVLTSTLNLTGVNDTPTLTDFSGPLASGGEDTEITLTYADLIGNSGNKAQVADADGTVTSLKVDKLLSGSLRIGSSAVTATAYVAGSNDVLNAGTNAYWTPAANANGPALDGFTVVAREDSGALVSIQPRSVQVAVTPDHADAASITSVVLPANDTYVLGQVLDFTVTFDRAVTVDTANGTPSLPLSLNSGGAIAAAYRSGSGTDTLSFRYTVGAGDLDVDGLSLGSALSLNNGTITSIDDSQPVNAGLSLPGIGSTAGLRVDGVNDAPVLGGAPSAVRYGENDPETAVNVQLTLSDSDSAQLSGATVTISAGLTAGDLLALPTAVATSTGITASYNSGTGVLSLSGDATLGNYQQALRAVTFSSSSDTPTATSTSRTLSWEVTDKDANTPATSAVVTSTLTLSAVNDNPTLTGFSAPVATGAEDNAVEISLAALLAAGNEADVDGQVTDFVVQALTSGLLRLGSSAATATDWAVGGNHLIDANTKAFWTPAANANGSGANALQAFTLLARDNSGTLSANPVTVKVNVTPVADAARITALNLPGNGTYAEGDTLKFTLTLDRDVTLDRSGGTPKLTLALNSGVSVSADLLGQKATYTTGETLDFAYTVQRGDLSAGGLSLPASLALPAGSSLTNTDDGFTVPVDLSLPRLDGTGVQIDGISPTLVSIEAAPGNRPNGETQSFRVTFSEPVRKVDASQFKLVPSGTASGRVSGVQAVNPVNGSAASYDLLVADIAGAGVLRFELRSSGSAIRDAHGNPFAAGSNDGRDLAVDRETPPAPVIGSVGGDDRLSYAEATDSGGFRISGTVTGVEAGQILSLTVAGSTVSTTAAVDQAGKWAAVFTQNEFSQLGNATHTLQATVSDTAGNAAPVGTRTFKIDREAPSLSNPTADPTRNPTLADSFLSLSEASNALTIRGTTSAEDGQQLDVRLGGRSQSAVIQNGNWQVEFSAADLATFEDGDLPLNLRISDVAGNLTNAGYNIVLDRTAQVNLAPVSKDGWINIAESTEGLTLSGLVGNVEDGQTINVLVGARANSPTTPYTAQVFNGEFTLTVPAGELAWNDGVTYEIAVSGQDKAGNPFSASRKVTADLTAPTLDLKLVIGDAAPVALSQYTDTLNAADIAAGVSIGSAGSNDTTLTSVSVGATEGLLVAPKQTGSGTTWSIPLDPVRTNLAPEGTVTVSASAIDAAGNTASASANIKVDRAASISIDAPVDGAGGNNQINAAEAPALTLGGSVAHVQNGASVTVTVQQGDRTVLNTTTTVNNGLWSVATDGSAWADGTYTVGASLVDSFGNPAGTSQKIQKNTAPPVFVKTAIAGDNVLNAAEASAAVAPSLAGFTTNAEDGQLVSITLPGAGSAAGRTLTAAVEGGTWSVPLPADLLAAYAANNGAFTANLSLGNLAGNTANSTLNFRVDTQTPTLTLNPISAAQAGTAALNPNTDTLSLSGTVLGLENEANQPVRLVVNGSELTATRESGNPANWSLSLPKEVLKSLQATGNDVEIQVKDLADNLTSLMASFNATGVGTTPPVIAIPEDRKVLADGAGHAHPPVPSEQDGELEPDRHRRQSGADQSVHRQPVVSQAGGAGAKQQCGKRSTRADLAVHGHCHGRPRQREAGSAHLDRGQPLGSQQAGPLGS
jgi:hypothetical protein